jgi:hypothetical protein
VVSSYQGRPVSTIFSDPASQLARAPLTLFQPGLRTPYVDSWFLGIDQPIATPLTLEVNYAGSLGRKLLTTDTVNRGSAGPGPIQYRANQGTSSYNSLSAILRFRETWADFQIAYTWSHAIDNQSEILRGDYFNLSASRLTATPSSSGFSAFSLGYDSSADRGNADFDQRQNLVFFSIVNLPAPRSKVAWLLRDWRVSQLAAFRSGAPFSVYALEPNQAGILNDRANLINPAAEAIYLPASAGERLLNSQAFAAPRPGVLGNSGRNAFRGPGFWDVDFSLGRSFPLQVIGERGKLILRADAFNVFNHANLGMPGSILNIASSFGIAQFGRTAPVSTTTTTSSFGLPQLAPVGDTSRQIQVILRVQF